MPPVPADVVVEPRLPSDLPSPLRSAPLEPSAWLALEELLEAIVSNDDPANADQTADVFEQLGGEAAERGMEIAGRGLWHGDDLVAFAANLPLAEDDIPTLRLTGGVHPQWRHLGLGRSLLGWQLEAASARRGAGGSLRLVGHADETVVPRGRLFERVGLLPVRRHLDLRRLLLDEPPLTPVPDGIDLRPWQPVLAEQVRSCHNAAFADVEGSRPVTVAQWLESLAAGTWSPEHSWIALADGSVVGYTLTHVIGEVGEEMGWTTRFGVLPAHRGRGLAAALLSRSHRGLHEAGVGTVGLGIDLPAGAGSRLFDALGYQLTDCVVRYEAILTEEGDAARSR